MGDIAYILKFVVSGIVGVGLVSAFALHATGLARFAKSSGQASSSLLNVTEEG